MINFLLKYYCDLMNISLDYFYNIIETMRDPEACLVDQEGPEKQSVVRVV